MAPTQAVPVRLHVVALVGSPSLLPLRRGGRAGGAEAPGVGGAAAGADT